MGRTLVCSEDGLSTLRISRILSAQASAFDVVKTPIRHDDLLRYDLVIIHSSYRLSGLAQFIEHLVLSQTIPVIYVSSSIDLGGFQRLIDRAHFVYVDENKLDTELPVTIRLVAKFIKELKGVSTDIQKAEASLEGERLMAKCKKVLMESGLSETEAHRYILKTAMDAHLLKIDACVKILNEKKS